jgi:hypothetical protein
LPLKPLDGRLRRHDEATRLRGHDEQQQKRGFRLVWQVLGLLLLLSLTSTAFAQARAWLDRDRIALGETVTLNIETTGDGQPDYAPLRDDFEITGRTSRRSFELSNGQASSRTLYAVALRPLREGVITIPALSVGNATTAPLQLVVTPASAKVPARAGDDVFIESGADDSDPYVQQTVGWVVRLYSAVPLVSGELDQPEPEGASLQRVGEDIQYTRQLEGRTYTVIERHYRLIPERSGTLEMPPATFEGRGVAGFFDDFFGSGRTTLRASAAPRFLEVAPIPANAPQPWLPLHDLRLSYQSTPQDLRVGSAATLVVEAVADGATAAQMPELQLPPIDGVQVFADPVQADERFVDGRPRVTLTRRFSLVPTRGGRIEVPGIELQWWDVEGDRARTARLPALSWQVAGAGGAGAGAAPVTAAAPADATAAGGADVATASANRGWIIATLLFAALWLFTLVWALQRRVVAPAQASRPAAAVTPAVGVAQLRRALDTGDFGDVAAALQAMAKPPARDLDEMRERLDDTAQRDAVEAMQRARWGDGNGPAARRQLREAFAKGPRWRTEAARPASPLPPLYPR